VLLLTGFFLKSGIHSKRTLWMAALALIPLAIALIMVVIKPMLGDESLVLASLFPQINFYLFLQFLLPLISIFIGTSVIADEVEERTLPYLLVRPVSRRVIVCAKLLAGYITSAIIILVSLFGAYSIMTLHGGFSGWAEMLGQLLASMGVLLAGLAVYMPLFALWGGLFKRPVVGGLLFVFGWEGVIQLFPGNTKLFTVIHYLNTLAPDIQKVTTTQDTLLQMIFQHKPLPAHTAIIVLAGMCAVFTFLASSMLQLKEYRLSQE
jgi:ABC-2 type transport system permease protein